MTHIDREEFLTILLKNAVRSTVISSIAGEVDDLESLYRAHEALVQMVEEVQDMIEGVEAVSNPDFTCIDCQHNTIDEYYMVHDNVWLEANPDGKGKLCIGCLEKRLGRTLTKADFTDAPLNTEEDLWTRSERLQNRLAA